MSGETTIDPAVEGIDADTTSEDSFSDAEQAAAEAFAAENSAEDEGAGGPKEDVAANAEHSDEPEGDELKNYIRPILFL